MVLFNEDVAESQPAPTAPDLKSAGEMDTMATTEERLTILRMIEQGKINADEGARLLAALGNPKEQRKPDAFDSSRMLRVRVSDNFTGKQRVSVNIPIGLVRFGLQFVPSSADVDVQSIQQAIESGAKGRIIDVVDDQDGKHVEIFIE